MKTDLSIIDEIYKKCTEKQCKKCISVHFCQFLKNYCKTGAELAKKFRNGEFENNPVVPYSCNLCGLCEKVCPQSLDIGQMCLEVRQKMVREGTGPMPRHKSLLDEQAWMASEAFALTLPPPDGSECKRLFFPGCGLSSYSPALALKTYEYVQEKLPGTGILLRCCGAGLHQIGEADRFEESIKELMGEMDRFSVSELIVCCPDCKHVLTEGAPHIQINSIYEVIAEHGLPDNTHIWPGKTFSLHDSCKARYDAGIQNSVREIIKKLGYEIEELKYSKEKTKCCGMGGLIAYADFKFNMQVIKSRIKEMPHDALAYCVSCRNSFAMVGKPAVHVLDLIFNPDWEKTKRYPGKQGPAKQKIMSEFRERLMNKYGGA